MTDSVIRTLEPSGRSSPKISPDDMRNVAAVLSQWRCNDLEHIDSVVEIGSELSPEHRPFQVAVGGGDDSNVCTLLPIRTHGAVGSEFQRAKQFRLYFRCELAKLV